MQIQQHPKEDIRCPHRAVLAEREKELLDLKGPCRSAECRLHFAHSGPCYMRKAD